MRDQAFEGVPVISLIPGSVAERMGVRCGDRVLIANGQQVGSLSAFATARSLCTDRLELTVQRGRKILDFLLVFERPDGETPPATDA